VSGSSATRREWSRMDQHNGSRNVASDMNGKAKANQIRPASCETTRHVVGTSWSDGRGWWLTSFNGNTLPEICE
jgi:hypothetical protein